MVQTAEPPSVPAKSTSSGSLYTVLRYVGIEKIHNVWKITCIVTGP